MSLSASAGDDSSSEDSGEEHGNTGLPLAAGYKLLPSFENDCDFDHEEDEEKEGSPLEDNSESEHSQAEIQDIQDEDIGCKSMPAQKIEIEPIVPVKLVSEDIHLPEENILEIRQLMASSPFSLPHPAWAQGGDAWLSDKIQEIVQKRKL